MPARKAKPTSMRKIEDETEISSVFPDDDSAPLTKREAAKARCVSLKQAAALLSRDRNTLMKYLDQGMPFVEKADRPRGISWMLDLVEVVRWLEERGRRTWPDGRRRD